MGLERLRVIEPNQLAEAIRVGEFHILKVDTQFDLHRLQRSLRDAISKFPLHPKDGGREFEGVGLQYSDPLNPYYDSIDSHSDIYSLERNGFYGFTIHNELGKGFAWVFEKFRGVGLARGRIIRILPGGNTKYHRDGNIFRLHVPIFTKMGARMRIEGESYHLAADGSSYVLNAGKLHEAANESNMARDHIIFDISPCLEYFSMIAEIDASMTMLEKTTLFNRIKTILKRDSFVCRKCGVVNEPRVAFVNESEETRELLACTETLTLCKRHFLDFLQNFGHKNIRPRDVAAWMARG